jgi:glucose/arabinose dehydrogenase
MIASGLKNPRVVRVAPNGDVFVADRKANTVRTYRLTAGSAKPAESEVFSAPLQIALYQGNSFPAEYRGSAATKTS